MPKYTVTWSEWAAKWKVVAPNGRVVMKTESLMAAYKEARKLNRKVKK